MKSNLPGLGIGIPPQPQFDIAEATPTKCQNCGYEFFDAVYRLGLISGMAPRNRTGQDVLVKIETYICRECGVEYGKEGE